MTFTKKFDPDQYDRQSIFKNKKLVLPTGILLIILVILEIWVNNTVARYGEKFEKISQLEESLKMENQLLQNEIAQNNSLSNIATKSAYYGFSKSSNIVYIR